MNKKTRLFTQKILAIGGACSVALLVSADAVRFDPEHDPYVTIGWVAPVALDRTNLEATYDNTSGGAALFRPLLSMLWKGDLLRYNVAADGSLSATPVWSAQHRFDEKMRASSTYWDNRVIFTANGSGRGIPFRPGSVDIGAQAPCEDLIDYVRGKETPQLLLPSLQLSSCGNVFYKPRYSYGARGGVTSYNLLGDIIHSNPVFVGAPKDNLDLAGYEAYKHAQRERPGRVYVGANDGMLHVFDATTGDEVFAYVPSMLVPKLRKLTGTRYDRTTGTLVVDQDAHTYFVDGELTAGDVQVDLTSDTSDRPVWQTVLAGGLGAGGCGLFALNVTDANAASEADAAAKLLWEIKGAGYRRSDELSTAAPGCVSDGDRNLGFTYGKPVIAQIEIGSTRGWYVITGNGYNSHEGKPALFMISAAASGNITLNSCYRLDASGCKWILDTAPGDAIYPNGLGSPTVVDTDGNGAADVAYAGDLTGKLWRFDLKRSTVTLLFQDSASRAITIAPQIARHPNGGYLVYFGTGQLLTPSDVGSGAGMIYAIWDRGNGQTVTSDRLFAQTLVSRTHRGGARVRVAGDANLPDWNGDSPHLGWKIQLTAGERVITHPQLRAKRLQLVTTNPAVSGGENWALEIDFLTGGGPQRTIFDLNSDGQLTEEDHVDGNGDGDNEDVNDRPLGRLLDGGILSQPTLARLRNGADATYINGIGLPGGCGAACARVIDAYNALVDARHLLNALSAASADPASDAAVAAQQTKVDQLEAALAELNTTAGVTDYNVANAQRQADSGEAPVSVTTATSRPVSTLPPKAGPAFGLGRHSWAELR